MTKFLHRGADDCGGSCRPCRGRSSRCILLYVRSLLVCACACVCACGVGAPTRTCQRIDFAGPEPVPKHARSRSWWATISPESELKTLDTRFRRGDGLSEVCRLKLPAQGNLRSIPETLLYGLTNGSAVFRFLRAVHRDAGTNGGITHIF